MDLVLYQPIELLGMKNYCRFGAEFPIRFDFLDTIDGQNPVSYTHLDVYKRQSFMNTAASVTSRPFFEKQGYNVLEEQIVERRGVRLRRYLMEKKL